jgi:ribosome recycling factor
MSGFEEDVKKKMSAALDHFKQELKSLRTNRANSSMLDNVSVEAYGAQMRIKELANITTPESRTILITPFDPQTAVAIAKGIEKANLNIRPIVDGHSVRINIPPMDESMRKEIVKVGKKKCEEAKIAVREARRKCNELSKKMKDSSEVTEDIHKKHEKFVQEQTDHACREIDLLFTAKEKEIMTV